MAVAPSPLPCAILSFVSRTRISYLGLSGKAPCLGGAEVLHVAVASRMGMGCVYKIKINKI
eukprot:scaffold30960_cov41-Tisochrysis_lutea.AAC.1